MSRRARLNGIEYLQHVIARGIENQDIFRSIEDRENFLSRLSTLTTQGNVQLLGWCLMPDHFHLLLRTYCMSLAIMMHRLLTGYAIWHNRKYLRRGHLFQNRYKSVIIEEKRYFLDILRYIHLTPFRVGLLNAISQLDSYPFTGHCVLMGSREFKCQDVNWVLGWFENEEGQAKDRYRRFIAHGSIHDTRNAHLSRNLEIGSGEWNQQGSGQRETKANYDGRILGSADFVQRVLENHNQPQRQRYSDISEILISVSKKWNISKEQILSLSRARFIARARREFFLRAHVEAGSSITELGRLCGITHSAVTQAIGKARREQATIDIDFRSSHGTSKEADQKDFFQSKEMEDNNG
jgi:putative transposase